MPESGPAADINTDSPGRLFLLLYRDFQRRCAPMLAAKGYGELSEAHLNVLSHIDAGGTRSVALAGRLNLTKQSVGDLVAELVALGYVTRTPDPTDKRAAIIRYSKRGLGFLKDAFEIKTKIEAEYSKILGKDEMERFFSNARMLVDNRSTPPRGWRGRRRQVGITRTA